MFNKYIDDDKKWIEFLNSRLESNYDTLTEKEVLREFIENKKYKEITTKLKDNNYTFSIPRKKEINKNHTNKKRVVYSYKFNEMIILKYIAYNLYKYDYLFEDNLYSFRKNKSVKQAIEKLSKTRNLKNMYGYKVDIKNYFNSVDISILINNLKKDIKDQDLLNIIVSILTNKKVTIDNNIIEEDKGIMAGIPLSAFLANYFIKDIDKYFKEKKVLYLRYSDDIILFANTKEEVVEYSKVLNELLLSYNLTINPDKENYYEPHDTWEFLGFSYKDDKIDLSENSLHKIKGKIRRSARSIRRWMLRKEVDEAKAIKVMIRKFNIKFYCSRNAELSWKYWYFPVINTSETLKVVDEYLQQYLRYIHTGKHNKMNYKIVPYSKLKRLGYKSLVHEYYLFINMECDM
jgi:retron-type reverse transcriptase